ncbi:hypothetical protein JN531_016950 (plasmid) [Flagellatimonas centrodinii]|uniref:hypothetical protein n=1 Tax=Flagellatimonas centrodinii TaxID=2806210 RepID=UPI001FFCD4B2|nr:hypothetical protein [Flagellatimonas centrodinii]ULQ48321.1 hypothetical protein JN531_016950 [Flagellatimonas centrodinii]
MSRWWAGLSISLLLLASACGGDEVGGITVPEIKPPPCVVSAETGRLHNHPARVWIVKEPRADDDLAYMVMRSVFGLALNGPELLDAVRVDLVIEPWTFDLRDGVEIVRAPSGVGVDLRFRSSYAPEIVRMVQGQRHAVLKVGIGPEESALRMIARRERKDCEA